MSVCVVLAADSIMLEKAISLGYHGSMLLSVCASINYRGTICLYDMFVMLYCNCQLDITMIESVYDNGLSLSYCLFSFGYWPPILFDVRYDRFYTYA